MKKYIERERVVDIAHGYCHTPDGRCCGPDDVVELYEELKAIPTVDAVPVVRCEDCKWWDKSSWGCTHPGHGFATSTPDYYCGDGERKGGDE